MVLSDSRYIAERQVPRKLIFSTIVFTASLANARAADLPTHKQPQPAPIVALSTSWNGFYVGLNAGYLASSNSAISNAFTDTGNLGLDVGPLPASVGSSYRGGMLGGQIGYNWQFNPSWVAGLEADLDGVRARNNTSVFFPGPPGVPFTTTYSRSLEGFGTARARVGYLIAPALLLFGTGGADFGKAEIGSAFICATCVPPASAQASTSSSSTAWRVGWTAGAGAEWKFSAKWSVKAEYLYANLGRQSNTIAYNYQANSSTLTSSANIRVNAFRVGVNYGF